MLCRVHFCHIFGVSCSLVNLAKRGYCNAGVCLSVRVYVYMCVRSHISHYIFVKWDRLPIIIKLNMGAPGYDTRIVEKFQ